jgi:FkbM family methyltransferase
VTDRASQRGSGRPRLALLLAALVLVAGGAVALHRLSGARDTGGKIERSAPLPADSPQRYLDRLVARLGPKRYSQNHEELLIRDFFKDRRGGFFVDVGASHYRRDSTTYYLERHLGWRGLAVDALEEYRAGYLEHRPRTRFFAFYVADRSDERAELYVVAQNRRLSTGDRARASAVGAGAGTRSIATITLDHLLRRVGVERVDFLSMDIELAEPRALAGFDIQRWRPRLVCIEAHPKVRGQIEAYFARHGYVRIMRYARLDRLNHYYRPGSPAR